MGWSRCKPSDIVPLTVINIKGDKVSFPGGIQRRLEPLARLALEKAGKRGDYKLNSGTCWGYSCRTIAGSNTYSKHAYGIAVDVNAPSNARGTRGNIPADFIRVMKANGFEWGGNWSYTDPMHFEFKYGPIRARMFARRLRRELRRK